MIDNENLSPPLFIVIIKCLFETVLGVNICRYSKIIHFCRLHGASL